MTKADVFRLAAEESALKVRVRRLGIGDAEETPRARNKQRREYAALLNQLDAARGAYETAFHLWMVAGFPDDATP